MSYTQAEAEASQNSILEQVRTSSDGLEVVLAASVRDTALSIAVVLVILLITLIIISLVLFVYLDIITVTKAAVALIISSLYIVIISVVFVSFSSEYTLKRLRAAGEVFNNFVSSETVIEIINGAAEVYRSVEVV